MKKAQLINLSGNAFFLEEPAHKLLEDFLSKIHARLADDEYKQKILLGIEQLLAHELRKFSGEKNNTIISARQVESVIQQVDGEGGLRPGLGTVSKKRLYRSSDDIMIAGVASGLAAYLGISPFLTRALFLLAAFIGGYGIIFYLVLWLLVPEAVIPVEKMELTGAVTCVNEIERKVRGKIDNAKVHFDKPPEESPIKIFTRESFNLSVRLTKFIGNSLLALGGLLLLVSSTFAILVLTIGFAVLIVNPQSSYIDFPLQSVFKGALFTASLSSAFVLILVPLIFISLLGITMLRKRRSIGIIGGTSMLALWVFAAISLSSITTYNLPKIESTIETVRGQNTTTNLNATSFDSIKVDDGIILKISQGKDYSLTASGKSKDIADLSAVVENNTLVLDRLPTRKICLFCWKQRITAEVTIPALVNLEAESGSNVIITGLIAQNLVLSAKSSSAINANFYSDLVSAEAEGASTIILQGKTSNLLAKAGDASKIDAELLVADYAEAHAQRASNIRINALISLMARANSASTINYSGNPKTDIITSGASSVTPYIKN